MSKCTCKETQKADTIFNKAIVMNGKLLHGCQACNIELSMGASKDHTLVHLSLNVHRDSIRISPPDESGKQTISFTTWNVCPDDLDKEEGN